MMQAMSWRRHVTVHSIKSDGLLLLLSTQAKRARISITAGSQQPPLSPVEIGDQQSPIVQRAPEASPRPRVPISPFQLDAQRADGEPFPFGGRAGIRRAATAPQQTNVNPFASQTVSSSARPQRFGTAPCSPLHIGPHRLEMFL